jgi:hypothetical protein
MLTVPPLSGPAFRLEVPIMKQQAPKIGNERKFEKAGRSWERIIDKNFKRGINHEYQLLWLSPSLFIIREP